MTSNLKPFRLVNDLEINAILLDMNNKIEDWNKEHALFPLSVNLSRSMKPHLNTQKLTLLMSDNDPIGILIGSDNHLMNYTLFGDLSDSFNTTSQIVLLNLLKELLGITTRFHPNESQVFTFENWFYKGSPSLCLSLICKTHIINIHLHPQWVMKALPKSVSSQKSLKRLEDVLAHQTINLEAELMSMQLQLADIMQLQIGDIIKTDHQLTKPVLLKHQHQILGYGELGEQQSYKSIQILRPL